MLTPRENMLRTIRCQEAEWMPITVYADNYNHPDPASLPPELVDLYQHASQDWGSQHRWEFVMQLSRYLGVDEYVLNAQRPYRMVHEDGITITNREEGNRSIQIIDTPLGQLSQVKQSGFITRHFINGPDDLALFKSYVASWRIELDPASILENKKMKQRVGERGMIWLFDTGTPLGMLYRIYADIENLIYMTADVPEQLSGLLDLMEAKYQEMFRITLENSPEIDILIGIDDTSTSIISPGLFDQYNVALTNQRADLAHRYGKFYMHHSCGLIHNLLPVYRKTRIDGVHAFTVPPIGDVTYSEGRRLLGDHISIATNFQNGLNMPQPDEQIQVVRTRLQDARQARHIMAYLATPDPRHGVDFLKRGLDEARKFQDYTS